MSDIRNLGVITRAPGRELSMDSPQELIELVKRQVCLVVSELVDLNDHLQDFYVKQRLVAVF